MSIFFSNGTTTEFCFRKNKLKSERRWHPPSPPQTNLCSYHTLWSHSELTFKKLQLLNLKNLLYILQIQAIQWKKCHHYNSGGFFCFVREVLVQMNRLIPEVLQRVTDRTEYLRSFGFGQYILMKVFFTSHQCCLHTSIWTIFHVTQMFGQNSLWQGIMWESFHPNHCQSQVKCKLQNIWKIT